MFAHTQIRKILNIKLNFWGFNNSPLIILLLISNNCIFSILYYPILRLKNIYFWLRHNLGAAKNKCIFFGGGELFALVLFQMVWELKGGSRRYNISFQRLGRLLEKWQLAHTEQL